MNLFSRSSGLKWFPDADPVNAPENALLRCDNTVADERGSRALRLGSETIYSDLQAQRVQSLHSTTLQGVHWRMAGIDNRVYANGIPLGGEFDGDGDIVFGDDSYQVLAARGRTRKKWDGSVFHEWSIAAPNLPVTLEAVDAITASVASFASGESPGFTTNEGTSAHVAGYEGTSNAAFSLTPDLGTGRASASKKWASDQNFLDIGGEPASGTDLFDFRVWMEDWRKVDKITVMFGLGTGTDPYIDDYYYFDFKIRDQDTVNIKDPASNAAAAYAIASTKSLNTLTPKQVTNVRSPAQAGEILKRLGRFAGPRSTERRDALEASPAWGHLTVTRGQFNRVGGTEGKNWSTVRAFKVVVNLLPGSTESIYFDEAVWTGGGARALTGTFTVGWRFARRFFLADSTEVYYELSPMSPISEEVTLNQQVIRVTLPAAALSAKDPQVTEVWAYIQGGWLDTYYRFAILPADPQSGMTIDEISAPTGNDFDSPEKRVRLTSWGFTNVEGAGSASADIIFTGGVSELEIIIDNEVYVPGSMPVPENVVGIAGPWNGRIFVLDDEGYLHPSSPTSPSNFSAYHAIDLRKYGTPLWVALTGAGIVAGFSKDIIPIAGTGDESEDRVIVDLYGDPLNTGSPPVDASFMVDGNTIIYRAADGFMALSGSTFTPVSYGGTSLLWRGESRFGVEAVNLDGRFRLGTDNHFIYALIPEGEDDDPTALWRWDGQEWARFVYPFTPLSIIRESSGALVVGCADGSIREIETGLQDDDTSIDVTILTPVMNGGDPLRRKDSIDFQVHAHTGGNFGTVGFYKDGAASATSTMQFATSRPNVYRSDITDLGTFLRLQLEITGSFGIFLLHGFNVSFRMRPQQVMALDLGYIIPKGGDLAWLTEAEIDCITRADLSLLIYKDDTLFRTLSVPITATGRTVTRVPLPKNTKSRRLRLVWKTTNDAGEDDPGFEPYGFRVRHRGSGNMTDLPFATGDAA